MKRKPERMIKEEEQKTTPSTGPEEETLLPPETPSMPSPPLSQEEESPSPMPESQEVLPPPSSEAEALSVKKLSLKSQMKEPSRIAPDPSSPEALGTSHSLWDKSLEFYFNSPQLLEELSFKSPELALERRFSFSSPLENLVSTTSAASSLTEEGRDFFSSRSDILMAPPPALGRGGLAGSGSGFMILPTQSSTSPPPIPHQAPLTSGDGIFSSVNYVAVNNGGQLVSAVVGATIMGIGGGLVGIAIIDTAETNGSWQYSTGGAWTDVGAVSTVNGLLLRGIDTLRFVPDGLNAGGGSLTYAAWDQTGFTAGLQGTTADTTLNGGDTAFSITTQIAPVLVNTDNNAPTTSGNGAFTSIDYLDTNNPGQLVSAVVGATISDLDPGAVEGIAITTTSQTNGSWQYDTGGGWTDVGVVSSASSLLLRDTDTLRFVPNALRGGGGTLTYRAWDETGATAGAQGTKVSTTANGGTTPFSSTTQTAALLSDYVNHAPTTSGDGAFTDVDYVATTNGGQLVSAVVGATISDLDPAAVEGMAITDTAAINGSWQYNTGGGWTDVGAVTNTSALLLRATDTVRFVPDGLHTGSGSLTYRAWDQTGATVGDQGTKVTTGTNGGSSPFSTTTQIAPVTVTLANHAPTTSGNGTFTTVDFIDTNNGGQLVSAVVGATISDLDPASVEGMAITDTAATNGSWQYDTGGGWTDVGAVTNTSALLLRATDTVRFVPDGLNAGGGSLTYRAWDQTGATAGQEGTKVTTVPNGTTTPFSTSTPIAPVVVSNANHAPTTSGDGAFADVDYIDTNNGGQLVSAVVGATISDLDPSPEEGIAITASTATNGSWQYDTGGGWTDVGAVTNTSALLLRATDTVRFVPDGLNGGGGSLTYRAWDQTGATAGQEGTKVTTATNGTTTPFSTSTQIAPVTVSNANHAPTTSGDGAFTDVDYVATNNSGQLVSAVVGTTISDQDPSAMEGMAITDVAATNGSWQYDTGSGWTDVGAVTNTSALLLRATDTVRFVPDGLNAGGGSLTYRAWDQTGATAGQEGTKVTTATNGTTTSFSTTTQIAPVVVSNANHAPTTSGGGSFTSLDYIDTNNGGQLVSAVVGATISDQDPGAVEGIAITTTAQTNGSWQYDTGGGWTDVGAVTNTSALLLRATDTVRFVPDGLNAGSGSLTYRAWDQTGATAGQEGTKVTTATNGTTTPFSTSTQIAPVVVSNANHAPTTSGDGAFTSLDYIDTNNGGQLVSAVLGATISDLDPSPVEGIAITDTAATNGSWQYSTGGAWANVGAVTNASALLLRATDTVRFVPDGLNAGSGSLTYRAWDQTGATAGAQGTKVTTVSNGGNSPFSTTTQIAPVTVTNANHAPTTSGDGAFTTVDFIDTNNGGQLVSAVVGTTISDQDPSPVEGIAITTTAQTNGSWQYDTGGGWTDVGAVTGNSALLLRATDTVRFVPDGLNGGGGSLTYRAWDQTGATAGAQGTKVDVSTNGTSTPFSTSTQIAPVVVSNANHAPTTSGDGSFTSLDYIDTNNSGQLVSAVVGATISDQDPSPEEGIAITAKTQTNGSWQYDTGSGWTNVGTVTNTSALLLRATDTIRFVPDGLNAGGGSLTYRAWDQTGATAGQEGTKVTTATNGTTTPFSTTTQIAPITVSNANHAPTTSGDGSFAPILMTDTGNSGQTASVITVGTISDQDPSAVKGMAITATDATNGSWQYNTGGGWTDVGAVSNVSALLIRDVDTLRFVPDGVNTGGGSLTYRAWDQTGATAGAQGTKVTTATNGTTTPFSTSTQIAPITVLGTNNAPTTSGDGAFADVDYVATNNGGQLVSAVVGTTISDVDAGAVEGMAITATAATNGSWQYNTGGGWTDVGAVSNVSALLIRASDTLRFVPDGLHAGSGSLTYRAWDQTGATAGQQGTKVDVSTNGGNTPFSTTTQIAPVVVTYANHAPTTSGDGAFTTLDYLDTNNGGQLVSAVVGATISDLDPSPEEGMAITATDATNGSWQYDTGGGWTDVGVVTGNSALLLRATDTVRFVPNGLNGGGGSLTYRAWDQTGATAGQEGTKVTTATNGTTTPFSTSTQIAALLSDYVNHAPTTSGDGAFADVDYVATNNSGQLVSAVVGATISDLDPAAVEGMAITTTAQTNGSWQYNTGGGWTDVGAVTNTSALLLRATDTVRFVPDGLHTGSGSLTYRAWDQTGATAGAQGTKVDVSTNGTSTPFSTTTQIAPVTVTLANHAPTTSGDGAFANITRSEITNSGELVSVVVGSTISDLDPSAEEGIAITTTAATNGTWQYSTGGAWTDVGAVSGNSALLLRAIDTVRFLPDGLHAGGGSLTYRAWDQTGATAGQQGTKVDVSTNGGTTPFSSTTPIAPITVLWTNSAPVLAAGTPALSSYQYNTVSTFANSAITDADPVDPKGIALTGIDTSNGNWYYSTNGTNWSSVGVVSNSSALLLTDTSQVYFVPNQSWYGTSSLTYRAWDQTSGALGTKVDTTTNGGTTAFSTDSVSATWATISAPSTTMNLSTLNGTTGFVIEGDNTGDSTGYSVAIGDTNGDGYGELLIASPGSTKVNVIHGKSDAFSATLNLSTLNGTNGFNISTSVDINLGNALATGDVNGSGYNSYIIGDSGYANGNTGAAFVVFGQSSGFGSNFNLSALNGTNGFRINGITAGDSMPSSVACGDINGNGYADVVLGARSVATSKGAVYVIYGKSAAYTPTLNLSTLDGTNGFLINGITANDFTGRSVAVSEINGNGYEDIIIGATGYATRGAVFVIYGNWTTFASTMNLSTLNGTNGFRIDSVAGVNSLMGYSVAVGDINGDGYQDIVIGDPGVSTGTGSVYVIFGQFAALAHPLNVSTLNGTNGFRIQGVNTGDSTGFSLAVADVDGDGYGDIIIGAPGVNSAKGAVYVVYGKSAAYGATLQLSTLNGTNGFRIDGVTAGDSLGWSLGAGDINGDGYQDILVSAYKKSSSKGAAYLVFGKDFRGFKTNKGTTGDDTLYAMSGADQLDGGSGNDILIGPAAGSSVLLGGLGNNYFNGGAGNSILIGGTGNNTFVYHTGDQITGGPKKGANTLIFEDAEFNLNTGLNLAIGGIPAGTIKGISTIDMTGSGTNTLTLTQHRALALTDDSHNLYVTGDSTDLVRMAGFGWIAQADQVVGSKTYHHYTFPSEALNFYTDEQINTHFVRAPVLGATVPVLNSYQYNTVSDFANATITSAYSPGTKGIAITGTNATNGNWYYSLNGTSWTTIGTVSTASALLLPDTAQVYFVPNQYWYGTSSIAYKAWSQTTGTAGTKVDVTTDGGTTPFSTATTSATWATITAPTIGHLNLGTFIDGTQGFKVGGYAASDSLGWGVSGGDVNNDGYGDALIGGEGQSMYVIYGKSGGFATSVTLSTLNGTNGFEARGGATTDNVGNFGLGLADINGNGYNDIIMAAPVANATKGYIYVFYGSSTPFASTFNLSSVDGTNGFRIDGVSGYTGSAVETGDINGDGYKDIIIGAWNYNTGTGAAYVIYGKSASFGTTLNLSTLNGTNGFRIDGVATNNNLTYDMAVGDINGDGYDDIVLGAPRYNTNTGAVYVLYGKSASFGSVINLSTLNGTNGFRIDGITSGDRTGSGVALGDVNGDGYKDIIIGAYGRSTGAGAVYTVFPHSLSLGATFNLSNLNGTNGFRINGWTAGDSTGYSVACGDVDGDGYSDVIIGSPGWGGANYLGAVAVMYGKSGVFSPTIHMSSLTGTTGFRIQGEANNDYLGRAGCVSSIDMNGDGYDDIIVGAPGHNSNKGAAYVIFGKDFRGLKSNLGTSGADTLYEVSASDQISGGAGNDILIGHASGSNILLGGLGNNYFNGGAGNSTLIGGNGTNTFVYHTGDKISGGVGTNSTNTLIFEDAEFNLNTGLDLDFTSLLPGTITNIRTIDMTGAGTNTLTFDKLSALSVVDVSHTLVIKGDVADTVLSTGQGWAAGAPTVLGSDTYDYYTIPNVNLDVYVLQAMAHTMT
jgi:hypothetical protein